MGVYLRFISYRGYSYLRERGSIISVPLIYYSALWLAGLGGGIPYYIMPSFHLYSSIALLFSFYLIYTNIVSILVLIIFIYNILYIILKIINFIND